VAQSVGKGIAVLLQVWCGLECGYRYSCTVTGLVWPRGWVEV